MSCDLGTYSTSGLERSKRNEMRKCYSLSLVLFFSNSLFSREKETNRNGIIFDHFEHSIECYICRIDGRNNRVFAFRSFLPILFAN